MLGKINLLELVMQLVIRNAAQNKIVFKNINTLLNLSQ